MANCDKYFTERVLQRGPQAEVLLGTQGSADPCLQEYGRVYEEAPWRWRPRQLCFPQVSLWEHRGDHDIRTGAVANCLYPTPPKKIPKIYLMGLVDSACGPTGSLQKSCALNSSYIIDLNHLILSIQTYRLIRSSRWARHNILPQVSLCHCGVMALGLGKRETTLDF